MNQEELRPDPLLGAALRWAEGEVPLEEVDWNAMRTNIRSRAAMQLARRRVVRRGAPRWLRPLIPVAAAASVAVIVWTGGIGRDGPSGVAAPQGTAGSEYQLSVEEALMADLSEQEFRRVVAGRTDPDELLMIAASQP